MVVSERDELAASVDATGTAVVLFTTPGCQGCSAQRKALSRIAAAHHINRVEIDADAQSHLAAEFQITSVPTTLIYVDGVQRRRLTGFRSRDEIGRTLDLFATESSDHSP